MFAAQGAWLRFKMALHVMAWQTKQPHSWWVTKVQLTELLRVGLCVKVL
jgi:hypothetical protein